MDSNKHNFVDVINVLLRGMIRRGSDSSGIGVAAAAEATKGRNRGQGANPSSSQGCNSIDILDFHTSWMDSVISQAVV